MTVERTLDPLHTLYRTLIDLAVGAQEAHHTARKLMPGCGDAMDDLDDRLLEAWEALSTATTIVETELLDREHDTYGGPDE